MSESVVAKVVETVVTSAAQATAAANSVVQSTKSNGNYIDIFDEFGVIKKEFDNRTESEMSPADMFFLTMSLFLVGGCVTIVGGYYLNRALRGNSTKPSKKLAGPDAVRAKKAI